MPRDDIDGLNEAGYELPDNIEELVQKYDKDKPLDPGNPPRAIAILWKLALEDAKTVSDVNSLQTRIEYYAALGDGSVERPTESQIESLRRKTVPGTQQSIMHTLSQVRLDQFDSQLQRLKQLQEQYPEVVMPSNGEIEQMRVEAAGRSIDRSLERIAQLLKDPKTVVDPTNDIPRTLLNLQNIRQKYPELFENNAKQDLYERLLLDANSLREFDRLIEGVDRIAKDNQGLITAPSDEVKVLSREKLAAKLYEDQIAKLSGIDLRDFDSAMKNLESIRSDYKYNLKPIAEEQIQIYRAQSATNSASNLIKQFWSDGKVASINELKKLILEYPSIAPTVKDAGLNPDNLDEYALPDEETMVRIRQKDKSEKSVRDKIALAWENALTSKTIDDVNEQVKAIRDISKSSNGEIVPSLPQIEALRASKAQGTVNAILEEIKTPGSIMGLYNEIMDLQKSYPDIVLSIDDNWVSTRLAKTLSVVQFDEEIKNIEEVRENIALPVNIPSGEELGSLRHAVAEKSIDKQLGSIRSMEWTSLLNRIKSIIDPIRSEYPDLAERLPTPEEVEKYKKSAFTTFMGNRLSSHAKDPRGGHLETVRDYLYRYFPKDAEFIEFVEGNIKKAE
jgi:hypothetical protein